MDTSGIEPDTFRKATTVRSERDKLTTPCAPNHLNTRCNLVRSNSKLRVISQQRPSPAGDETKAMVPYSSAKSLHGS